jgi:hypothetical protein
MPNKRAHAAEHDDGQDHRRFQEHEGFGRDETLAGGEEGPGKATEHRADGEKAVSLVVTVLMPSERQAISSSRSASQARPIGMARNLIDT